MAKSAVVKKSAIQVVSSPVLTLKDLYVIGDRAGDPEDHPLHRRRHAPSTPELIASIESDGVRVPISVASILVLRDEAGLDLPVMKEEGWEDLFLVVNGVRRVDAVREVNARLAARGKPEMSIKSSVVDGGLMEAFATRVVSNDFASTDPPSVRGQLMAALAARRVGMVDIGRWFGIGEKMARNYVKFNKCVPEVKDAVDQGKLTLTMALGWADSPQEKQISLLTETLSPPASKASGSADGGTDSGVKGSEKAKKPGRKLIREIASMDGADEVLPKGFVLACRWVDGAAKDDDIPGLGDVMRKIAGKPAAKRGRKPKKS
jgi:hypothetical protein